MDPNYLQRRPRLSAEAAERAMTPRDKRAYEQFARNFAQQIHLVRDALAARPREGAVT